MQHVRALMACMLCYGVCTIRIILVKVIFFDTNTIAMEPFATVFTANIEAFGIVWCTTYTVQWCILYYQQTAQKKMYDVQTRNDQRSMKRSRYELWRTFSARFLHACTYVFALLVFFLFLHLLRALFIRLCYDNQCINSATYHTTQMPQPPIHSFIHTHRSIHTT